MFSQITLHNLDTSAAYRLNQRKSAGPCQWHPQRPGKTRGFYVTSAGLACGDGPFRLRLEYANDLLPRYSRTARVESYWADDDGWTAFVPIVARLPRGRGFLAGHTLGHGMSSCVESSIYRDAEDAAYAAHSMAEFAASEEREYIEEQARQDAALSEPCDDDDDTFCVHHDVNGWYVLTASEACTEEETGYSVGLDGRPHHASEAEAWRSVSGD